MADAELSCNGWNAEYVDALYEQWRADPDSVDAQFRQFFQGFELGLQREEGATTPQTVDAAHTRQGHVDELIYHFRDIGHLAARLDPLGSVRALPRQLDTETFGLDLDDMETPFDPGDLPLANPTPLREILGLLWDTYCRTVAVEYMHIQNTQQRQWLQTRMEQVRNRPAFDHEQKMRILRELIEADGFESFLDRRYTGKKRFSLQGGEALIPILNEIVEMGPAAGVQEFTIGMAHRGRLNVLVNILQKSYHQIFTEFAEAWTVDFLEGGGDVKYHRGYSSDHATADGRTVRLTLSPNPSHLEFVTPVVQGRARAKQRLRHDISREQCVPIIIHGDAAFPGQGVVAECLNMVRLDGYTVGGTLHIVVNNRVGFTTEPRDLFSGRYCTDIAKMTEAPIFHVNGDDPEACVYAALLALEYRQAFKNDVVIDMWCYRKYGHNEGDEPSFTQPQMYERIKKHRPVLRRYADQLIAEGEITAERFDQLNRVLHEKMDEAQALSAEQPVESTVKAFGNDWAGIGGEYSDEPVDTTVARDTLAQVSRALGTVPEGFPHHRKLGKLLEYRGTAVEQDQPLDWAMGELLAYGSLLLEGHAVRLTGQDVERGTFSHRHAVIFDQTTGDGYEPLNQIEPGQAKFCVHNSPLTEAACVGFEYGYSLGDPRMLIIWEAQFGDFANGAQVIFDQFIASAEVKWKRFTGLTVFLPHGYEGQGPEHSSARLERFLALCAHDNMLVVYPTTPAQIFHMLRLQMKRSFRKPLVVMTPKSLLRHPAAVSPVKDLADGGFRFVIDDPSVKDRKKINRVLLCTGKIYYDLIAHREQAESRDVAIVRLEQIHPFPRRQLHEILSRYPASSAKVWVQEEPRNMGAWRFVQERLRDELDLDVPYVGREEHASPAVASQKMHEQEQRKIMIDAIGLPAARETSASGPQKLAKTG